MFPQQQAETPTPNPALIHHLIKKTPIRLHSPPITPVLRLRRIEPHAHNGKPRPVNHFRRMHERGVLDRHATNCKVIGNEVAAHFRVPVVDIEVLRQPTRLSRPRDVVGASACALNVGLGVGRICPDITAPRVEEEGDVLRGTPEADVRDVGGGSELVGQWEGDGLGCFSRLWGGRVSQCASVRARENGQRRG